MGLQLIFVMETNKKCKSDWIYIKDTIERFFHYDMAQVKLSPVYMNGKGKYKTKEKEIESLISQYQAGQKENRSEVIYCFDCDDYDSKPEDARFLEEAKRYCSLKGYDFIWFCKDVERVYLGKKVEDSRKKSEAAMFKAKNLIQGVDENRLKYREYGAAASNIINVVQQYLKRK